MILVSYPLRDAILNHPEYDPGIPSDLQLSLLNGNQMIELNQNYHFVSIPLEVGLILNPLKSESFSRRRLTFTALAGISADILLKSEVRNNQLAK